MEHLLIEFIGDNESKWKQVKEYILPIADHVEFNILYSDSTLDDFLIEYEDSIELISEKKEKTYKSGKVLRLVLTNKVKRFVESKSFEDFNNWILEDPSFYIDDNEVISTISHEGQIYFDPLKVEMKAFSNFNLQHKLLKSEPVSLWRKLLIFLRRE